MVRAHRGAFAVTDLTVVTGIWDLGRDGASPAFRRSFSEYERHLGELLDADCPMIVFGEASLEEMVRQRRGTRPTEFRLAPATTFRDRFAFYDRVQAIRADVRWREQAPWLAASPQASLALYNPMVMSKMFMLHDVSLANPFRTAHFAWIDGGITRTVDPAYFTRDRCLERVVSLLDNFLFVSFPYEDGTEVHGFARNGMRAYCGDDSRYVCRGGFFGGHIDLLSEVNSHYYEVLESTLHAGLMGTEESVFTILTHEEPQLYDRFALREAHRGLLTPFFEHVKTLPIHRGVSSSYPAPNTTSVDPDTATLDGYVVTFNAPQQLRAVLASWAPSTVFDALYLLDHSTDPAAQRENREIAEVHGAAVLHHPLGNGGVCGGRQFVAEHFDGTTTDYCLYIEDDMFLNPPGDAGLCANGFRRSVSDIRRLLLRILAEEGFDFLKLSFTEVFGDHKSQFAWYHLPEEIRARRWREKPMLRPGHVDPACPRAQFGRIGTVDGVSYIDGEVYYSNWPHIVSRAGNRTMFLEPALLEPYEQVWMAEMYQRTIDGHLHPAVLLASLITHDRSAHYPSELRREH
ncbi:MAG: hypothetical protein JWO05_3329 [Gemmatimonadetes bacterium]|nr:hypothetical protein [Gemmatimonadota bacterium]